MFAPNATGGTVQYNSINLGIASGTADQCGISYMKYGASNTRNSFAVGHSGISASQLVLTRAGYLGILNDNPLYNLDVAGTANVTGVLTAGGLINKGAMCYAAQTTSLTPIIYNNLGVVIATPAIGTYYYIKTDQNTATSFNWTPSFVASPYIHCLQIPCNSIYSIHFTLGATTGVYDFLLHGMVGQVGPLF